MDICEAGPSRAGTSCERGPIVTAPFKQSSQYSGCPISRKRLHSPDDDHSCKRQHCGYHFVLESDSGTPTDEDSESCCSMQLYDTVSPKDSSDTSSQLDWSSDSMTVGVEFEVASLCEEKLLSHEESSGTDDLLCAVGVLAAVAEEDPAFWADSSDAESTSSRDSEVPRADYWTCLRCKCPNNNPLFRYCEKCYQIRKDYFPERPKKSRRRLARGSKTRSEGVAKSSCKRYSRSPEDIDKLDLQQCNTDPSTSSASGVDLFGGATEKETKNNIHESEVLSPSYSHFPRNSQESINSDASTFNDGYDTVDCPDSTSSVTTSQNCELSSQDTGSFNNDTLYKNDTLSIHSSAEIKPVQNRMDHDIGNGSDTSHGSCFMCFERPKNGIFVHKKTGHIIGCYQCSLRVWNSTRRCPMCQQRPLNILKAIVA